MTDLDALLTQLAGTAPAHLRAAALANASLAVGRFAARWADGDEAALGDGQSARHLTTARRRTRRRTSCRLPPPPQEC